MNRKLLAAGVVSLAIVGLSGPANADHSWSTYHWKTANGIATPLVVDNTSSDWKPRIEIAVADWNKSPHIESDLNSSGTNTSRRCSMTEGTIQVCNGAYGFNGWLGIASISVSGGHIIAGSTRLNDSYFALSQYNGSDGESWKQLVACQEIGHDYGLGHQNEDFDTDLTTSCMEYTSAPSGNEGPDAHDYQQLVTIYGGHSEGGSTGGNGGNTGGPGKGGGKKLGIEVGDTRAEWGRAVGFDAHGRANVFEQVIRGYTVITHVTWAPDAKRNIEPGHHHDH